jgi:hypothetical protein
MAKLTKATQAQLLTGARYCRAMDAGQIEHFLTGSHAQVRMAMGFIDWCAANGKTFGAATLEARFAEYQAAPKVQPKAVTLEPFNDGKDVSVLGQLLPGREHAGFLLTDAKGGVVETLRRLPGETLDACRARATAKLEAR